jgi:capsular polysaccharide biosynthesis protein
MDLVSSLRRRWILTCVLLLLTVAATFLGILKLATTYQSQSSVILLASQAASKGYGGNPYLAFNATLNQTADVVRYEVMDQRTVAALAREGNTSTYLVVDAIDTSGPVLIITVTGHNPSNVEHTLSAVTSEASAKLAGLQTTLTPLNRIRSLVITFQPKPKGVASKKVRPLSVIAGGGILLTIGIPLLVDAIITRRRAERTGQPGDYAAYAPERTESGGDYPRYAPERTEQADDYTAPGTEQSGDDDTAVLRAITDPVARPQPQFQPTKPGAQPDSGQDYQPDQDRAREQQPARRP